MRVFAIWVAVLAALTGTASATPPNVIIQAEYVEPTTRYDHGILGDAIEWGALKLTVDLCAGCEGAQQLRKFLIRLPENRVFEDVAPRIVTMINEGSTEVLVVETDLKKGARLALYDEGGLITATPFIGRTHRWLAPIGVADLDGDGTMEVAYVDRPHLAKRIRVWGLENSQLKLVAELDGFTNHRIGESEISGGVRTCDGQPELIVATGNWQQIAAVFWENGQLSPHILGPNTGPRSFTNALKCKTP